MEKLEILEIHQLLLKNREILENRIEKQIESDEENEVVNPTRSDLAGRYDLEQRKRLLLSRAEHQLKDVEDALERFEKEEYGKCIECGQLIHPKRLAALPTAAYCIQCKQELE
jgi:DnaK suppressor protein